MSMSGGNGFSGGVDWSNLPSDIVNLIRDRLEVIDYVRSAAVCSSWHNYSTDILRRPQIPWLVTFSNYINPIKSVSFFSISEHKKRKIFHPKLGCCDDDYCMGSSHGYLIYLDEDDDNNLHAANPITGAHLAFPASSKLPNVVGFGKSDYGESTIVFTIPAGEIRKEYPNWWYFKKAILSPSGDTVAVIERASQWLSFARNGDDSWTNLTNPMFSRFFDIVFHKGRLHAVDDKQNLYVIDLDRPLDDPFVSMNDPIHDRNHDWTGFPETIVVESPNREDLFLVHRREYETRSHRILTEGFKVSVLDKSTYKWKAIQDLGDITIFVGGKCSMSLRSSDFSDLRRNSIYFFERYTKSVHLAVFNLKDGSIEKIYSCNDRDGSGRIWFVPTLV